MKNHFFISWFGNKREEVENIYKNLDLDGVENIIEPYCGSCALSYYISILHPKKYKYILNDSNKFLIELLETAKDPIKLKKLSDDINEIVFKDNKFIDKVNYNNELKKDTLTAYMIGHKYYTIRAGLWPNNGRFEDKKINLENCPMINFLRNEDIEISCGDGVKLIEEFKNYKDCLLFLDPPYMRTENSFYDEDLVGVVNKNKEYMNVYEYLCINNIKKYNCKVYLVLEDNWIIRLLFNDVKDSMIKYSKVYQTTKKKTSHLLIKNII